MDQDEIKKEEEKVEELEEIKEEKVKEKPTLEYKKADLFKRFVAYLCCN